MHGSLRIAVHNLFYTYPDSPAHALCGIDLTISSGTYVAVLGGNGSGKSTLLKCVNGLVAPTTGGVTVYGDEGKALDPAVEAAAVRRIVGTVLQNADDMIVGTIAEEDVAFGPQNLGLDAETVGLRVAAALEAVGLSASRTRPPQFLSGGEKSRLAIAGALAMDPRVLLLDEPASMLDPRGRENLLVLLDRLAASGTTIVHVTHALEEAARAGRCLVLHQGGLVFDGDAPTLFAQEKLERWGLRLPESVKALQGFFRLFPGFSAPTLDPEAAAAALLPYLAQPHAEARALLQPAAPAAPDAPAAQPDSCALRFDAVGHDYLPGTSFAATGIREVSLTVPAGATLALVGTTGSGKSTLLRHANAVLLPRRGRVLALGLDTRDRRVDLRQLRLRVTLGVQNPEAALFEAYVADDVAYGPRNKGQQGAPLRAAVRQAMELTGLAYDEFKNRGTRDLSGGEKRRAALAGVLALDGELVLLDEPTAALDGAGRERILHVLDELRARGKTVLATTHSMEEAAGFDLVAVMQAGALAAVGPPEAIFGSRWSDDWGLALPWTAAVAAELRRHGRYPHPEPPLTAAALIAGLDRSADKRKDEPPAASRAQSGHQRYRTNESVEPKRRRRGTGVEFFRNVTLGQFLDRPSFLLRRSAGTKLAALLGLAVVAVAGPHPIHTLGVLLFTLVLGAAAGRIGPKHLLRGLVPALPYLALMVAVQFAFRWPGDSGPILIDGGFFTVTAGELNRSLLLVLRLATLMALLSLYSALTPLAESLRTLSAWIAPLGRLGIRVREFSLAVGIALRFVPVLVEEAERIAVAQISRGGGYGGKKRLRAAAALIVPLFLRALERSETLATAMELRLFGKNPPGGS